MEILAGVFAGKEFISILILFCAATDKIISDTIRKEAVFLNIVQSKSFLMRSKKGFHAKAQRNAWRDAERLSCKVFAASVFKLSGFA